MRTTLHNQRTTKSGRVFSPRHNDRDFDVSNAKHINPALEKNNEYIGYDDFKTFDELEQKFYAENFSSFVRKKNAKAIAARHSERVISTEDYRHAARTCPEEVLLQIGDRDNHADADVLRDTIDEFVAWHLKTFVQCQILDIAIHNDEAVPHVHLRRVWTAIDGDGDLYVSETQSLAQMGIERPNPSKPKSKYNNAKITYTRQCREKWEEIVISHGFRLDPERLERSKTGRDLEQVKAEQDADKIIKMETRIKDLQNTIKEHYFRVVAKATLSEDLVTDLDRAAEMAADAVMPDKDAADLAKKIVGGPRAPHTPRQNEREEWGR